MDKDLPTTLREQLDAETYKELALAVRAKARAAARAGYQQAMKDRARSLSVVDTLRGMLSSWTAWASVGLFALPDILPILQADLPALLGPGASATVMRVCAGLMLILRIKTTASLAQKAPQRIPPGVST